MLICATSFAEIINSSDTLVQQLCHTTNSTNHKLLVLNSSIEYDLSSYSGFCVVRNANITITTDNNEAVNIFCASDSIVHPTAGIAFINSTVLIENLIVTNCGAELKSLPNSITNIFNSSSFYYPLHYAAASLFIQSVVTISKVTMMSSYGFSVIGIDIDNSTIIWCWISSYKAFVVNIKENKTIGNGVLMHFLKKRKIVESSKRAVLMKNCKILWNTGHCKHCEYRCIKENVFERNDSQKAIMYAVGVTILYDGDNYPVTVRLENMTFSNNVATFTNSLLIVHYYAHENDTTEMSRSEIKNLQIYNEAVCPESAEFTFLLFSDKKDSSKTYRPLVIDRTEFHSQPEHVDFIIYQSLKNIIYIGIKGTKKSKVIISFSDSEFHKNFAAGFGTAFNVYTEIPMVLHFNSMYVYDNQITLVSQITSSWGLFSLRGEIDFIINGTEKNPSLFRNNFGMLLYAFNKTNLYLHGHVIFTSNRGSNGAVIHFEGDSQIHFMKNSSILFKDNKSAGLGGAIYAVTTGRDKRCAMTFEDALDSQAEITFVNNSALQGGSSIYAYPVFNCYLNGKHKTKGTLTTYEDLFEFSYTPSTKQHLSTLPTNFSIIHFNESGIAYPGQIFYACITATDVMQRNVYATVKVTLLPEIDDITQNQWLSLSSTEQTVKEQKECTNISIPLSSLGNIDSKAIKRQNIVLYLKQTSQFHLSSLLVHNCPHGFVLDEETRSCICSPVLETLNMKCSIQTQTIAKLSQTKWAGVVTHQNKSKFAVSSSCPSGYCATNTKFKYFYSNTDGIQLKEQENSPTKTTVCVNNREGPLCSECSKGLVAVLGSAKCIHCSSHVYIWLNTLLTLMLGPVLIILLYTLKLTLTTGTLNGIIFYTNILNTGLIDIMSIETSSHAWSTLNAIIRGFLLTLNLDYGFPVCFLKNMNQFWKASFGLIFPYYLLALVGLIIFISRYSSWVSKHTSHSSVQVLVTVVHLSFSNLLLKFVTVFSSTKMYIDDGEYRVWLYDGSAAFLTDSRHQTVAIVSSIAIFPLLLSYVCFLTFTKQLMKFSSKCNLRLRPIYEAIHAPYKNGKEYWFTIRLILLIFTCILWSVKTTANAGLVHIITASLLCIFLVTQAIFRPFTSKKLTVLDSWTILNLLAVYVTLLLPQNAYETTSMMLSITVALVFITLLFVVIYHMFWVTGLVRKLKRNTNFRQTSLLRRHEIVKEFFKAKTKTRQPLLQSDEFYEPCGDYREPLLDD